MTLTTPLNFDRILVQSITTEHGVEGSTDRTFYAHTVDSLFMETFKINILRIEQILSFHFDLKASFQVQRHRSTMLYPPAVGLCLKPLGLSLT